MNEPDGSDFAREWIEFLNEVRVALPGVQLLFGFLLMAPFAANFHSSLNRPARVLYMICFLTTTAASAFLMAPSVYHRLHWRRDVRDKEQMMRTCNRLAIVGGMLLAVSMTMAGYIISCVLAGGGPALAIGVAVALMFLLLWFALPLSRRSREKKS
jgi:uncharacterized protein DUF6328